MSVFSSLNNFTNLLIQKHSAKLILISGTWLQFTCSPEDSDFIMYSLPIFLLIWLYISIRFDLFKHDINDIKNNFEGSLDL